MDDSTFFQRLMDAAGVPEITYTLIIQRSNNGSELTVSVVPTAGGTRYPPFTVISKSGTAGLDQDFLSRVEAQMGKAGTVIANGPEFQKGVAKQVGTEAKAAAKDKAGTKDKPKPAAATPPAELFPTPEPAAEPETVAEPETAAEVVDETTPAAATVEDDSDDDF